MTHPENGEEISWVMPTWLLLIFLTIAGAFAAFIVLYFFWTIVFWNIGWAWLVGHGAAFGRFIVALFTIVGAAALPIAHLIISEQRKNRS